MTLETRDLACIRGERRLFRGLGFKVEAGRALVVEGPNGTGKSSLLRLLAGFLAPAQGQVLWEGQDVAEAPGAHRRRVAWIGHLDALKPALSVTENLRFWRAALDDNRRQRQSVRRAVDRLGLDHVADLPARYLSAGQRRRLALARLVLVHRPLWLLDEPTTALDAEGVAAFRSLLEMHLDHGGSAVIASHLDLGLPAIDRLRLGIVK
ncbi:heme ABC exporter ATP-binding protein CcmA [Desertibaculum subflavum]|uniref:heme ABC exporter ATP-binding protein CcmA n=1 Tax=Desertibaculum subflavum TaxID=2268458 RepID=UPI000E65F11A